MKLDDIRRKIDKIDRELLVLLQERMGLAIQSKKFKTNVADLKREEVVLARAERMNLALVERSFARQLLSTIIDESKRLQKENRKLVAFQGEHGAYGEVASRHMVPNGAYIPCLEFVDVFRGVENGNFDLGVVPVENSLEGAVTQVNDLLTTTHLHVVKEVKVPVNHCLLAPQETNLEEIRVVYSHPQALAQCNRFLLDRRIEPRPFYDTAGAAKMLARENPRAAAAIASELCSELYDLDIIAKGIEDGAANHTRFLLLSRDSFKGRGGKTSIIFATAHEAGRLFKVLGLFAEANINLTRIASMPLRSDPGNYSFFVDFEGDIQEEKVANLMKQLDTMAIKIKCLGSYPAYPNER